MMGHKFKLLGQYLRTPAAKSAEDFGNEIEEEITFHLAERTQEYIAKGMPDEEARWAAMDRFGDASRVAADCHAAAVGGLAMWHRLHLTMTAVLTLAVALLWFTLVRKQPDPTAFLSQLPPGIASMLDNDWTGDVCGQIIDENSKPIENARVLVVVKTWPDESYFQRAYMAMTDSHGRFLIENVHPVNEQYAVQFAAVADHRVLKSAYRIRESGTLEPEVFQLPPSSGMVLQVEASRGNGLAGVEILPQVRVDTEGTEHLVYFDSAQPIVRRTDSQGVVELPYFEPGDTATVLLRTPQGEWESRDLTVPAAGEVATIRTSTNLSSQPEES